MPLRNVPVGSVFQFMADWVIPIAYVRLDSRSFKAVNGYFHHNVMDYCSEPVTILSDEETTCP